MRGRLVTPPDVPDVFVSGLGRVELLDGGVARFYFYREIARDGGEPELETVLCIVGPLSAVPDAIKLLITAATSRSHDMRLS